MSTTTPKNRNRLIAIAFILIVFVALAVWLANRFIVPTLKTSTVGSRIPISGLKYCSSDPSHLCVLSFGQILNGPMQVDLLAPYADHPEFKLNVSNNGIQSNYECQSLEQTPEHVYCTGSIQAPGSILALSVLSKSDNSLLATGTFTMIGIAIVLPQEGPASTEQLGSRIPDAPRRTPLSTGSTPSYPNPSYP